MSSSTFRVINALVGKRPQALYRFMPSGVWLFDTEHSGIILVGETRQRGEVAIGTLDRIASIISNPHDRLHKGISKDDVVKVTEILRGQAAKLEALAATYRLMAVAMTSSLDDFADIVRADAYMRKTLDNPFD